VGVAEMKANGETTMVLGFPAWLMYLALVPGLLLSAVVGLHAAVTGARAERSEGAF
jgi:TRAP-type C4-dicarboxylate transport system permease small subunit